jgi:hypothetical protein
MRTYYPTCCCYSYGFNGSNFDRHEWNFMHSGYRIAERFFRWCYRKVSLVCKLFWRNGLIYNSFSNDIKFYNAFS